MAELRDEHFEVISENKAKAHEQQKGMRDELAFFVMNCSQFNMQELYSEMKRMKRMKNDNQIGRAHVRTPVTRGARMPSSA